jgi:putative methionine-R-sulfoxide reductase with GAF domain
LVVASGADLLRAIEDLLARSIDRALLAREIAAVLRPELGCRWVGLYDVSPSEVAVIGWSGPSPPAHPRFPPDRGLTATAVQTGRTVICEDVRTDARYLEALGDTRSEMIVPVLDPASGMVVGTLDFESDEPKAFGDPDRLLGESVAQLLEGRLY